MSNPLQLRLIGPADGHLVRPAPAHTHLPKSVGKKRRASIQRTDSCNLVQVLLPETLESRVLSPFRNRSGVSDRKNRGETIPRDRAAGKSKKRPIPLDQRQRLNAPSPLV